MIGTVDDTQTTWAKNIVALDIQNSRIVSRQEDAGGWDLGDVLKLLATLSDLIPLLSRVPDILALTYHS